MKHLGKILTQTDSFKEIMMGNWAIVRAMIESNVDVVTSYPGSPTPEIAQAIAETQKFEENFYFEFSTNEKVALELAFGASINGLLSCVFFKSVGLNVAADSFVQLSMMETIGGIVIILGDDPGANSSQNEQDNRHLAQLSYIPVLEPQDPQEAYFMLKEAFKISKKNKMPIILRLTTHVCHAKQKISFSARSMTYKINESNQFSVKNGPYIPITSKVFPLKIRALSKLNDFKEKIADSSKFVKYIDNKNPELGIITMGLPFLSLLDTLEIVKVKPDVLKIGVVYPLPEKRIIEFIKSHNQIKILEELDPIIETQIKALAFDNKIQSRILGKIDKDDWLGEYTPGKVENILRKTWPEIFSRPKLTFDSRFSLPPRPAQLCPGCGHRSAFYAIKKALSEEDYTVADIGCHTLGFLPPYEIGQVLLSMGHSNGTASGLAIKNDYRKVVSFLGDSTLFHAGLPGIINAVFNKHKHTLIIMENGTTAMTGHQDHPATGKNFNDLTEKIPIRGLLTGMGVKNIWEVDTYRQEELTQAVKAAINTDDFSVVIAKHPCMLKFIRELKKQKRKTAPPITINTSCNLSKVCLNKFACPTYQLKDNQVVWVQEDLCIGDGSCKPVCPQKALESKKDKGDTHV